MAWMLMVELRDTQTKAELMTWKSKADLSRRVEQLRSQGAEGIQWRHGQKTGWLWLRRRESEAERDHPRCGRLEAGQNQQ